MKRVLVTSGSTRTMIDQVRCLSNVFNGRTGYEIANYIYSEDVSVILLTSNKVHCDYITNTIPPHYIQAVRYQTYEELYEKMEDLICKTDLDAVIHSAAVSDYRVAGTYAQIDGDLVEIDSSTKIGSDHDNLFLKLEQTEKIIDKIRDPWGFKGKLVKFKLQVGMSDEELIEVANKSRKHSNADMIVANCLEWCSERAYIISEDCTMNVLRKDLPMVLAEELYGKKEN